MLVRIMCAAKRRRVYRASGREACVVTSKLSVSRLSASTPNVSIQNVNKPSIIAAVT